MKFIWLRSVLRRILVSLRIRPKPRFFVRSSVRQPGKLQLKEDELIAVEGHSGPKWACFLCPCGSREVVRLPLGRDEHPTWSIKIDYLGRPTIHPSIWHQDGCRCHFWIRKGQIDWV